MLFNTPYFKVLNANTSSAPVSIFTGNLLIKTQEYCLKRIHLGSARQGLTVSDEIIWA